VRFEIRDGQVAAVSRSNPAGPLRYPLAYESCCDIRLYLGDMIRFAADAAEAADSQGHRPRLRTVMTQAPWQLFKSYVLGKGWLDGWAGLHVGVLSAFAVYLRETMLWERQQPSLRSSTNGDGRELKVFPDTVEADVPTIAFPAIRSVDEGTQSDSEERRMRPAA
jgi:hypothetical protein